jgi:hypothetical protein
MFLGSKARLVRRADNPIGLQGLLALLLLYKLITLLYKETFMYMQ